MGKKRIFTASVKTVFMAQKSTWHLGFSKWPTFPCEIVIHFEQKWQQKTVWMPIINRFPIGAIIMQESCLQFANISVVLLCRPPWAQQQSSWPKIDCVQKRAGNVWKLLQFMQMNSQMIFFLCVAAAGLVLLCYLQSHPSTEKWYMKMKLDA